MYSFNIKCILHVYIVRIFAIMIYKGIISLCYKLLFSNPNIKGCKDIVIRGFEFVARTQFLSLYFN